MVEGSQGTYQDQNTQNEEDICVDEINQSASTQTSKVFKRKKNEIESIELKLFDTITNHFEKSNYNQENKTVDTDDEDKLFCLSIVKELKKIPEDYKLDAKTDLLHTLKKWQNIQNQQYSALSQVPQVNNYQYQVPTIPSIYNPIHRYAVPSSAHSSTPSEQFSSEMIHENDSY